MSQRVTYSTSNNTTIEIFKKYCRIKKMLIIICYFIGNGCRRANFRKNNITS